MDAVVLDTELERVRLVAGIGENDPDVDPLEMVAVQRKVIEAARPRFDVILLDTAPFLTTNDASELLDQTDQVILVVRAGKTSAESATSTELLDRLGAPLLGIVFNDSHESRADSYYYDYDDKAERNRKGRPPKEAEPLPDAVELVTRS